MPSARLVETDLKAIDAMDGAHEALSAVWSPAEWSLPRGFVSMSVDLMDPRNRERDSLVLPGLPVVVSVATSVGRGQCQTDIDSSVLCVPELSAGGVGRLVWRGSEGELLSPPPIVSLVSEADLKMQDAWVLDDAAVLFFAEGGGSVLRVLFGESGEIEVPVVVDLSKSTVVEVDGGG